MPRLPKDYSKTLIYKLVCNDLSILECYVGHTTDFTRRKSEHKKNCNNEKRKNYNLKVYKTIRENCGWNNWTMIEVEKYPCIDDNEARAKEREWFEILNSNLNTQHPNRSRQEYRADNRDNILIQKKQYREEHKEELAIQQRQYKVDNREKISIQHRQYYEDNRDDILIKQRQYDATHKEEIATRRKQTFTCGCGGIITMHHKSRHLKTRFHLQYMESILLSTIPAVPPITDTQLVSGNMLHTISTV
jgi:hypothetical protein